MSKKKEENSLFKSELYFDLGGAVDDITIANGVSETAIAGGKLLGKTISNTAVFAGKLGLEMFKRAPDVIEKNLTKSLDQNKSLSPEERAKHEAALERVKELKRRQEARRERQ